MAKEIKGQLRAEGKRFALVVGRFNELIGSRLLEGALDCLRRHGAREEGLDIFWVPGAFELPFLAKRLAPSGKYDAIICLGAVIRGETPHFDFVAKEVTRGIAQIGMESGVPVGFGVITSDSLEQALERAGAKVGNRGWDAALSVMEMADLLSKLR
jgi:6,7-dimethyl-8-ribityllumazine synthase